MGWIEAESRLRETIKRCARNEDSELLLDAGLTTLMVSVGLAAKRLHEGSYLTNRLRKLLAIDGVMYERLVQIQMGTHGEPRWMAEEKVSSRLARDYEAVMSRQVLDSNIERVRSVMGDDANADNADDRAGEGPAASDQQAGEAVER